MDAAARDAWENALIEDLREHDGRATSGPLAGHPIMVMYTTGAKSGARRRALLTYSRDGEDYVVAGSASGSPKDPAWLANLAANPEADIELGRRELHVTATITQGAERERLWAQHVEELPHFAAYPEQSGRVIPVVRLTPQHG